MLVDSRLPFDSGTFTSLSACSPTFNKVKTRLSGTAPPPSDFPWLDILREVISFNQRSGDLHDELQNQCTQLAEQHQQHQERSKAISAELERLKSEQTVALQAKVRLEGNIQDIQQQLHQSQEMQSELSAQLSRLQQEKDALEARLSEIEEAKTGLETDLSNSREQIQRLREEVEALTQNIRSEQGKVVTLTTKVGSVRAKRQQSRADLRRTMEEVTTLNRDLAAANTNLETTQDRLSQTEQLYDRSQENLRDREQRESLLHDFIPSLHQKMWTRIISMPSQRIERPVVLVAYLIYAVIKYALYKAYVHMSLQRELQQVFRAHLTYGAFQQAASSIEMRVLNLFARPQRTL